MTKKEQLDAARAELAKMNNDAEYATDWRAFQRRTVDGIKKTSWLGSIRTNDQEEARKLAFETWGDGVELSEEPHPDKRRLSNRIREIENELRAAAESA